MNDNANRNSSSNGAPTTSTFRRPTTTLAVVAKPSRLKLSRQRLNCSFKSLSFHQRNYHQLQASPSAKRSSKNKTSAGSTSLLQLVARRDWQMVLIRASLFPSEIHQMRRFAWDGVEEWNLLPLHLACALDPPALVIEKLLYGSNKNNDKDDVHAACVTATMTMTKRRRRRTHGKSNQWFIRRRHRHRFMDGDTDRHHDLDISTTEDSSATPSRITYLHASTSSSQRLFERNSSSTRIIESVEDDEKQQLPDSPSALASNCRDPPWSEADALLPLHVACLYRASPAVIQHLCQAHPAGARCWAWGGRLPIHMLSSQPLDQEDQWVPPIATTAAAHPRHCDDWRLADALQHLVTAYPESVSIPSRTTNRTPLESIEEMMDDGITKRMCLRVLGRKSDDDTVSVEDESETSLISEESPVERPVPSEILCDDQESIRDDDDDDYGDVGDVDPIPVGVGWRAPNELYALMVARKWECAYDLLEDEPEQAHKWQYGIETDAADDKKETQMWKRLPIHNCCRLGAPVALLSIVLRHNPNCPADPYTGALPIHLACQYAPSLETIHVMLYTDPSCTKHQDNDGLLPIHYACRRNAPTPVLQALLKSFPGSVMVRDKEGKTPLEYCCLESTDAGVLKTMTKLQSFLGRVERRKHQSKRRLKETMDEGEVDAAVPSTEDVVENQSDREDDCDESYDEVEEFEA